MPRHKSFDVDRTLDRALELFWTRGYDATSLQDLVEHLGVNRRALYETYGDKRALYEKALARYRASVGGHLYEGLISDPRGVEAIVERLQNLEAFLLAPDGSNGCFVTNCIAEGGHPDSVYVLAAEHLRHLERAIQSALDRAAERGELRNPEDNTDRARLLVSIIEGLFVMARLPDNDEYIRSTIRAAIAMVRGF